ncbi:MULTISPECIES: hypothetical protein [Frankia]|uniref:Uncharacterized protein n=1 Tax=Frankia alni (strain DSM 45986 / CECT 9034 / ACN14a) TaxID=326424 RepID=Q0RSF0_FRAAA|nr:MULTISPECIES: hypothetical protein [Frankia]CAJ59513.1 hypothetical protein; putative signal peptide; putative Pyridoxine 5'-phosphate synthase domain [Frankia alni ACN14a]
MSAGIGVVSVAPTISAHAALGAAQTAAVAAAGTVVVVAAGVAVAGAAGAGMSWAVAQSLRFGADRAARTAAACEAAVADARRWESTVHAVAERNARIGQLTAAAVAEGIPVDLALVALGRSDQPDAVLGRCGELDRRLADLEGELARRRGAALLSRLHAPAVSPLAAPSTAGTVAAGTVTGGTVTGGSRVRLLPQPAGGRGATGGAGGAGVPPAAPAGVPDFAASVQAEMRSVLTDARIAFASVDERAALADAASAADRALRRALDAAANPAAAAPAAAAVARGRLPGDVDARLAGLHATAQDVWDAVRRRQAAAADAAVLIQPLLPDGPGASAVDSAGAEVRTELLAVLAGRRALDGPLRGRAIAAVDAMLAEVARRHQAQALREAIRELADDPEHLEVVTAEDGTVEVRAELGGQHELRMALRRDGRPHQATLAWTTVRTVVAGEAVVPGETVVPGEIGSPGGRQPSVLAADSVACAAAADEVDRVAERLAVVGVEHEEETRRAPGAELPVDAEQTRGTETSEQAAARRRAQRRRRNEAPQPLRRRLPGS